MNRIGFWTVMLALWTHQLEVGQPSRRLGTGTVL